MWNHSLQETAVLIEEPDAIQTDPFAEVTRLLLEKGADLNTRDKWGRTPLMIAARAGNREMVDLLMGWEADLHARDQRGYTALMYAAWKGHVHIVRALIERGADVRSIDSETGYSPILLAALGAEEAGLDFSCDLNDMENMDRDSGTDE